MLIWYHSTSSTQIVDLQLSFLAVNPETQLEILWCTCLMKSAMISSNCISTTVVKMIHRTKIEYWIRFRTPWYRFHHTMKFHCLHKKSLIDVQSNNNRRVDVCEWSNDQDNNRTRLRLRLKMILSSKSKGWYVNFTKYFILSSNDFPNICENIYEKINTKVTWGSHSSYCYRLAYVLCSRFFN